MPYSLHVHHFQFFNRELTELYASVAIKGFAVGLIGIFEPIYLYLFFGASLSKLFIYYGVVALLFALAVPLGAKLVAKIGIKHAMLTSVPFALLYFLGLWQIEALGMWFPVLILLSVLYKISFWPAFHTDFTRFADRGRQGRQLSYRFVAGILSGAISPAIGGLILAAYGFPALFILVLILLFVSAGVLFFTPDVRESYHDSFEKTYQDMGARENRGKVLAFLGEGAESTIYLLIWPLFLFLIHLSFGVMGMVVSGAMLIGALFLIYLGRVVDSKGGAKVLRLGAVLNALTWPLKIFVVSPWTAFFAHTLHQFTRTTALLPLGALFYGWAGERAETRGRRVVLREMALNTSRSIMLFLSAGIFYFVEPMYLRYYFLVAGVLSLGFMFFIKRGEKQRGLDKKAGLE